MQRLLEFIGNHAWLASAAILAAAAVAFYEIRERMQAFAALSTMQAVRLMNQGALVIDLRGKELYDAGHIGDARNVPVAELASLRGVVTANKPSMNITRPRTFCQWKSPPMPMSST